MINRRRVLCSREPLATVFFLFLILAFFFALPNMLVRAEPASSGRGAATGEALRFTPGDMNTGAPDTSTVTADGPEASQADYPVLPLTVVPKPEASPLVLLKAPDTNLRMAVLALVLALLSAITFIFWRYHRRDYASPRRNRRGI
jgi:hypothetical protein